MIAGILLAAGSGTRFGSHKLLHPLADGTPLALAALRNLMPSVDQTFVVVRPDDTALIEVVSLPGVTIVPCAAANQGMGASLACGVQAASQALGWVVALGDMPFIAPATVRAVADQLRGGAALVAPTYQGRRGHPVGFAAEFFAALSTLRGDSSAKSILDAQRVRLQLITCNDPGVLRDVDEQRDLLE